MNNTIKGLLIFVAGACTGSLVTLFVCRREMRNLVAELEELYESVEDEPPMPEKEYEIDDEVSYCKADVDHMKKMSELYGGTIEQDEINKLLEENYQAFDRVNIIYSSPPSDKPYIITFEDFNERFDNHEKLELTYYDGDGTLVDEGEELIADFVALIGENTLERFGEGSEDPDVVYVRNEKLGVDYEVIRVNSSFKDMVINGGDD